MARRRQGRSRHGPRGLARFDAVELGVYHHLLAAIPEEMGAVLMRSAFSPNIKERLDYSCALTGQDGGLAAQASHIPVHLGSTHVTAQTVLGAHDLDPGDMVLLNDPFGGGTHLPDVTLFAPIFFEGIPGPAMGVLTRAHHADIGGAFPGSMGPAEDLHAEGLVIPPVRLYRGGQLDEDLLGMVLANTRTPEERAGDLRAQASAVTLGCQRLQELAGSRGANRLLQALAALRAHAARATRAAIRSLKDGEHRAALRLDGPGTPWIRVRVVIKGTRLLVDFSDTDPQTTAPLNANQAITISCVFYVVRLLVGADMPTNAGCLDPVKVVIPPGCLLNARRPAAVAGGNVETSQRVVDVLLRALSRAAPDRIPASSQGTMNNLSVGGHLRDGRPYTFYETLGGGAGGGPCGPGASGLHTHMTNTLNTPVEALESALPLLVSAYHLRRESGGAGRHAGGEGLVREFTMRSRARVTLLATRRREGAPGLRGGRPGAPGRDRVCRRGSWEPFPPVPTLMLEPGDRVRIETPGGGGHGRPLVSSPSGDRSSGGRRRLRPKR